MCTSPTGRVPLSDLLDRQSHLRASRGSCNKKHTIGSLDKYSFSAQSQLYTSICTHIHTYSTPNIYIHICIVTYIQVCMSFIPMPIIINPCTHVYIFVNVYISSQLIRYCYFPASISTKKIHPSVYYIYIYIYILSCK